MTMKSEENEFSAEGLLYPCKNPGQSSHESTDSGCCEAEGLISGCQKQPFIPFKCVSPAPQSHKGQLQNHNSYPTSNRITSAKQQRGSAKKGENTTLNDSKEGIQRESNGPSYKYLTWREKDRRRRFREEWKHLWLVIPHGMYEVMCLVCKKIMTQRKLDTIKRHTIRRHAELLSMSDMERQRLYNELVAHHFRRGDMCSESESFLANSVPKLRSIGNRVEIRSNQRLPSDMPPSAFRFRMTAQRRCENEKASFMNQQDSHGQFFNNCKPPVPPIPPANMKMFENLLSNEQHNSAFTKYLMGFHHTQFLSRGKFDPSASPIGRRNPLPHTCGMGTSHAFQVFKKQPSTPIQRPFPESYADSLNNKAPLDMTTSSATSPVQLTPDDLSIPRYPTANSEPGVSLTERLMRLMNTWDSAAVNSKSLPSFPPPLPTSIPLLPSLLTPQFDGTTLMLNR